MRFAIASLLLVSALPLAAQTAPADTPGTLQTLAYSPYVARNVDGVTACSGQTTIYDTTHASNQGAEITAAANGPATSMGDLIVLGGSSRFVCRVTVEVFTLAATTPFDLTMRMWTACSTDGAGGSACGTGPGTLIPNSTVTVTGITPPALGTIFQVVFDYPNLDLNGEADNTISVSINASRSDVFWRIGETVAVGSQPVGEPAASVVERCGSAAANNGCSRNFGLTNNFAILMEANTTPVSLMSLSVD